MCSHIIYRRMHVEAATDTAYTRVYIHTHTHTYIYTHTHTHIHTHTHVYTCTETHTDTWPEQAPSTHEGGHWEWEPANLPPVSAPPAKISQNVPYIGGKVAHWIVVPVNQVWEGAHVSSSSSSSEGDTSTQTPTPVENGANIPGVIEARADSGSADAKEGVTDSNSNGDNIINTGAGPNTTPPSSKGENGAAAAAVSWVQQHSAHIGLRSGTWHWVQTDSAYPIPSGMPGQQGAPGRVGHQVKSRFLIVLLCVQLALDVSVT
jgi:hypothetical protein